MRQNYTLSIFLFFIIGFCSTNLSYGQSYVDAAKEAMEAKRLKKMEKSPAKAEIQAIERNLNTLEKLNKWTDKDLIEEKYEEFGVRLDSVNTLLPLINSKDPKWKTNDYEDIKPTYKNKYSSLAEGHKKHLRFLEIEKKLESVESQLTTSKMKNMLEVYTAADIIKRGEMKKKLESPVAVRKYFMVDYNINEILALVEEMDALNPEWMKSYYRKDLRNFFPEGVKALIATSFEDMQNHASAVSEYDNLEELLSDYWLYIGYLADIKDVMVEIAPEYEAKGKGIQETIDLSRKKMENLANGDLLMGEDRLGKIFFTKGAVERADFDKATPLKTWDFSEGLHFRYFMEKTAMEYDAEIGPNDAFSYAEAYPNMDVYIGDKLIFTAGLDTYGKNSYRMYRSFSDEYDLRRRVANELINLKYGTHTLTIKLSVSRKNTEKKSSVFAAGSIDFIYNDALLSKLKNNENICLPKAEMNNSALANEFLAVINKAKKDGNQYFESTDQFSLVRIISPSWAIIKNEYTGLIIKRNIAVLVAGKDEEGNCVKMTLGMSQDYTGGGNYGSTYVSSTGGRYEIPCLCF